MAGDLTYDTAIATLYQAPLAEFVAERKRLAVALKAAGDRDGATRFAKLGKPTVSAWVVDQLYWHARAELDAMFATAARLRSGELAATAAHREAIAQLRVRATALLAAGGHPTTEAILRRVTTTLAALAAVGGFAPDLPGTLAEDRDPPGFEAAGIVADEPRTQHASPAPHAAVHRHAAPTHAIPDELANARALAAERQRELAAKHQRDADAKRIATERSRLTAALATARAEIVTRERGVTDARAALATAETAVVRARTIAEDLAAKLADLGATS